MHQSGHCRAHSMHTVQLSSTREITPRERAVIASRSCGYCTVTAGRSTVMHVVLRPLTMPTGAAIARSTFSGSSGMEGHLGDAGHEDVGEGEGNEDLPGEGLQLVLPETRKREPHPEDHEPEEHDLAGHHAEADDLPHPGGVAPMGAHARQPPTAEEQHRAE